MTKPAKKVHWNQFVSNPDGKRGTSYVKEMSGNAHKEQWLNNQTHLGSSDKSKVTCQRCLTHIHNYGI